MAANTTPQFIATGIISQAQVNAANTNRDGSGTLVTIATGGTAGTLLQLVRVVAEVTTTAGMVRLFINNTSDTWLFDELDVPAVTVSATQRAWSGEIEPTTPLILPAGYLLRASTHNAETFTVFAIGGDY